MPVQLYKDQKKIYTHAPEDIKSKMKKNEKYSIFGKYQGAMNFAYVPISNVERNNKGLYTESYREPSYYNENLHRLNRPSIDVPVWLLPFTDKSKDENQVIEPVSIVQPVTPSHKEDERLITQLSNQAEKTVEQLGIAQNVKPTNTLIEKTFTWPYGGNRVILTGDFDNWQESIEMSPVISNSSTIFTATVTNLDVTKDIEYKFIVDGQWCFDMREDTIKDNAGNVNNILYANK